MQRKPRLLVVEDEAAIRGGLVDVFVYHGFDVDTAVDGEHGLALALSGRYDLILLDVMLPQRDGYSVCEAVRDISARSWSKPLSEADALLLRKAHEGLCQEWAASADVPVSQASAEVNALLQAAREAHQPVA